MARPKKNEEKVVTKIVDEMCNDLDEIETVPDTVPEPTEVIRNDVLLPRSKSRYKAML